MVNDVQQCTASSLPDLVSGQCTRSGKWLPIRPECSTTSIMDRLSPSGNTVRRRAAMSVGTVQRQLHQAVPLQIGIRLSMYGVVQRCTECYSGGTPRATVTVHHGLGLIGRCLTLYGVVGRWCTASLSVRVCSLSLVRAVPAEFCWCSVSLV